MEQSEDLYGDLIESDVEVIDDINEEDLEADDREGADHEAGAAENADAEAASKPVKARRIVRNPQPKLNAETLKGSRGLTAVESYFDRVKFKGRGYEEQDLNVILKTYEYWCHRLFPKYPFDECIAKIEHLGQKKPVQTHLKKIRLEMLIEDQPTVPNDDDDDSVINDAALDNQFDDLLDEAPNVPFTEPPIEISEEQLERIRLNKERAEHRRRERLKDKMEMSLSEEISSQNLNLPLDVGHCTQSSEMLSESSQVNEEQIMERIRLNKEKAEQRRKERLTKRVALATSQEIGTSNAHLTVDGNICSDEKVESQVSPLDREDLMCHSAQNIEADLNELDESQNSQSGNILQDTSLKNTESNLGKTNLSKSSESES